MRLFFKASATVMTILAGFSILMCLLSNVSDVWAVMVFVGLVAAVLFEGAAEAAGLAHE